MATAFAVVLMWTVSLAGLFAGAVSDYRRRIIPNRLVALTAGCGILLRLLAGPRAIGVSLAVALTLLLLMGLMARRQWLGGGDAKMIAAATLLVPPGQIAPLLLAIMVAGGLLSGIYLFARHASRRSGLVAVEAGHTPRLSSPHEPLRRSVPYGVAIFAGTASFALTQVAWWFYATS